MRAIILFLVVAIIFCVPSAASLDGASARNIAYLVCNYDAVSELALLSVICCGEELSAVGVTVEYDVGLLDYTGYCCGDGFSGFDLSATLENDGRINILAHSGTMLAQGEIIKLCFKVKNTDSAESCRFSLLPLSSKSAAVIENGGVRAVDLSFIGVKCELYKPLPQMICSGTTQSGGIILSADHEIEGECLFDIAVVELSGNIRRLSAAAIQSGGNFALDIGGIADGYTSVIVEPYYFENGKKVLIERGIYLFYEKEYIG